MKKLFFLSLIFIVLFNLTFAQEPEEDPLAESYIIRGGGGEEIVKIKGGAEASYISIYKYFREMEFAPGDTMINMLSYLISPGGYGVIYDIAVNDLDADGLNEIVAVWTADGAVEIVVLKPDPDLLGIDSLAGWQREIQLQKQSPVIHSGFEFGMPPVALVQIGNFDSDSLMEFIVAWWADDGDKNGYVNLTLFDISDSLTVEEKGSIMDQVVQEPPIMRLCEDYLYLFDLECADFNGDGIDEILLTGRESMAPHGWQLFANLYTYNEGTGQLENAAGEIIYTQPDTTYDVSNINLAVGHFNSVDKEQAVIGINQYNPYLRSQWQTKPADTISYLLFPVELNDQLAEFQIASPFIQMQDTIPYGCYYNSVSTLISKDLNNDRLDEILATYSTYGPVDVQSFKILQMQENSELTMWADLDTLVGDFFMNISVGDIRKDTLETKPVMEILVPNQTSYGRNWMYQIITDAGGNFVETKLIYKGPYLSYEKTEPVQVADFDGDIRLGAPRKFSVTKILQPLVILNAPPIHFDVLDDTPYDVSLSYNNNDGKFVSSYVKESSQFAEVETEVNMDWSLSWTAGAGFSFFGVSVSSHLSETYGKRFSKVANSSTKVTVGISVDAIEDDRIYAMVMDYNIYEYPVYVNDEVQGNVLVVEPLVAENRWFPSKSWSGYDYIPNHEVGNILSYREYPLLSDNPVLDEKIKGDYNNSFVLDANSSYDWSLLFEDFQSNEVTTAKEFSRDWGASVSGWGMGFSLNGSYNREDIQTQRTEVSNGLQLDVHLDAIDPGIGEVGYIVTPYAYWANNGALVIDYAVKPELSAPGGTDTWWQVHYGDLADPAFILPWRYDPEKGFTLQDEAKRYQTKDIIFYPANPRAGDIITIESRVNNFGLKPTPGPMGVKFYIGNPDSGGTIITGIGGETEVFTGEAVPSRGTKIVKMDWKVPSGIGTFPRIYAVIDEQNTLPEIHENNNKSWNILQKSTATAIVSEQNMNIPNTFSLKQNYPNPFNPITTIEFSLTHAEFVQLEVFNTLGERVDIIESKELSAGNHAYHFDARMLPSGLYFYRIQAGDFHDVKKMILLR